MIDFEVKLSLWDRDSYLSKFSWCIFSYNNIYYLYSTKFFFFKFIM